MHPDMLTTLWTWLLRNSNALERFWTATYLVGFVCGLIARWLATRDETWQYVYGTGSVDRMFARKELRNETRTCLKLALGLLAGVVQMTTPNVTAHPTRAGYVTTACVALMGVIMTYGSTRNLYDRLAMRRESRRVTAERRRRVDDPPLPSIISDQIDDALGDETA